MNYKMPAEWAPHERTLIAWPVKEALVYPENYDEVCQGYAEVVKAILPFEAVTVIVNRDDMAQAQALCGPETDFLGISHNDGWCRDTGPTFVYNDHGDLCAMDWRFNAWGEKYTPYDLDDALAERVLRALAVPAVRVPLILEGGSIHVDGIGTLLSTEECLLNVNRNPKWSRLEIESLLKEKLGVSEIIWLAEGLVGDETDGHIDNVACFAEPGVVLVQTCSDPDDDNYARSKAHLKTLHAARDAAGNALQIIEIPQPPRRYHHGERLTLSYLNFYLVNGGVILPVFGGDAAESDAEAKAILERVFKARKVVCVDGMKLIKEGGNVHCITQQMPLRKEPK